MRPPLRHPARLLPGLTLPALALAGTLALAGCGAGGSETAGPETAEPTLSAGDGGLPEAGDGGTGVSSGAACLAAVTWQGTLYIQVDTAEVEQGEVLAGAEVPPCNDTGGNGAEEEQAQPVDAYAVQGVDPRYAVTSSSPGGQFVYVAEDYVPGRTDAEPLPREVRERLGLD